MTTNPPPSSNSTLPAATAQNDRDVRHAAPETETGRLVPLKTIGEIKASNDTTEVYVVEIPARAANALLSALRSALPEDAAHGLQHLRRVVLPTFLPERLKATVFASLFAGDASAETRLLLVSLTTTIALDELVAVLAAQEPFASSASLPRVHILSVPSLAPISAQQADHWSATYWPIAYKHTNPFGPHPSLVARAQAEIESETGAYLAMAREAAAQAARKSLGEDVGAVVVERAVDLKGRPGPGEVVVVAGDGRWRGLREESGQSDSAGEENQQEGCRNNGNVMAHAALRAIALIAQKRLRTAGSPPVASSPMYADTPLVDLEEAVYARDNLRPNGYLCSELEIYLTREPCVMCSMAILHSRFGRCVIGQRMPRTGGMTADEDGLQHGLFWRPAELNWKFLAWEWKREEEGGE